MGPSWLNLWHMYGLTPFPSLSLYLYIYIHNLYIYIYTRTCVISHNTLINHISCNTYIYSNIYIYIYIIVICKHKVSYPLISCSPAPQITSTKWSPILRWSPLSSEAGILMDFVFDDHRLLMDYNK